MVGCCQSTITVSLVRSGLIPSGLTVAPAKTASVMNNSVLLAESDSFLSRIQSNRVCISAMCLVNSLPAIPPSSTNHWNNLSFKSPNSRAVMLLKHVSAPVSPKGFAHMLGNPCIHHRMPGKASYLRESLQHKSLQQSQILSAITVHILFVAWYVYCPEASVAPL